MLLYSRYSVWVGSGTRVSQLSYAFRSLVDPLVSNTPNRSVYNNHCVALNQLGLEVHATSEFYRFVGHNSKSELELCFWNALAQAERGESHSFLDMVVKICMTLSGTIVLELDHESLRSNFNSGPWFYDEHGKRLKCRLPL